MLSLQVGGFEEYSCFYLQMVVQMLLVLLKNIVIISKKWYGTITQFFLLMLSFNIVYIIER